VAVRLDNALAGPGSTGMRHGRLGRLQAWIAPAEAGPVARLEWVALGLVMLVALALRVVALDSVPLNITADEKENLMSVWGARVTGNPGFFGLDWKPAPAFSIQLFRASMAVFGDDIFGMRVLSAIVSVLGLAPFYALARRTVQAPAALAASVLLAGAFWYLHFARSGWENIHTAVYALAAAWALTVALERGAWRWFAMAGVFAALGLYGYFSGRLILPALLATAPLALWRAWRGQPAGDGLRGSIPLPVRRVLVGYVVMAVVAIGLFVPQGITLARNWESANGRVAAVSVFNQPRPYFGETTAVGILGHQTGLLVESWVLLDGEHFGDERYMPMQRPPFDPWTKLLILVGFVLGLALFRRTAIWWSLLAIPLVATQLLTDGAPDTARALQVAPFYVLFATLPLQAVIGRVGLRWRRLAGTALVTVAVLVAWGNVAEYWGWIHTESATRAREPSIEYADFERWRAETICGYAGQSFEQGMTGAWVCVTD
jgi:4-amino-4-deoxy-L-arabinose transferase-like glycosyltransferase